MTVATIGAVPVSGERRGALRGATVMFVSWITMNGESGFAPTYSPDSTLRIGAFREPVVSRDEDPVLISTWDNESDDIFDTI